MHRVAFVVPLMLALACAGASKKEDGPKPDGEPAEKAGDDGAEPEPEPEPAPEPAPEPIPCGDKTCTPPEKCLTVVGSIEGAPHSEECWIPCGHEGDVECPEGMECSMIHDGPGQVCVKTD